MTPDTESDDADGSLDNPFGHLVRALNYGIYQVSQYGNGSLSIYLLNGDHYMTRNLKDYFTEDEVLNKYALNYDILIQPVFCGETYDSNTFTYPGGQCIGSSTKLTINYKMGGQFSFQVPRSLTIKSLIFDALD